MACAMAQAPQALAQVRVDSADPAVTEQGTVNLNVTIKGRGFKTGASSKFLVTGSNEDTGGVLVNSTTVVDSTTLISNISVSDGAKVGSFDIAVTSGGRTGKGIEKFAVTEKNVRVSSDVAVDLTIDGEPITVSGEPVSCDFGGGGICSEDGTTYLNDGTTYVDGNNAWDIGGGIIGGNVLIDMGMSEQDIGARIYVDFGSQIALSDAAAGNSDLLPPSGLYYVKIRSSPDLDPEKIPDLSKIPAESQAWCVTPQSSGPIQDLKAGECQYNQLGFALFLGGENYGRYRVHFHRVEAETDDNTSRAVVTCLENGPNGKCSEWLIEPELVEVLDEAGKSLGSHYSANLVRADYKRKLYTGPQIITNLGYFDMPFRMWLIAVP
jgi:hypothetical protein